MSSVISVIAQSSGFRRSPESRPPATRAPDADKGRPGEGRPAAIGPTDHVHPDDHDRPDGRDSRWVGHRDARRAEFVRTARRAIHHLGPDLSMDELAAHLGTSKSILYRYFGGKAGLQAAIGQSVLRELREALSAAGAEARSPRDRLGAMVATYLEMTESSRNVYTFVTRPHEGAAAGDLRGFVAEVEHTVAEALLPVLVPGAASPGSPDRELAALWAAGMVGFVRGVAERWLVARSSAQPSGHATLSRPQLTEHVTAWLWYGAGGVGRRARSAPATDARTGSRIPSTDTPGADDEPHDRAPH